MFLQDNDASVECVGCGCDNLHACLVQGQPCSWLVADELDLRGVCSGCPADLGRFLLGDREIATP